MCSKYYETDCDGLLVCWYNTVKLRLDTYRYIFQFFNCKPDRKEEIDYRLCIGDIEKSDRLKIEFGIIGTLYRHDSIKIVY